MNKVTLAACVFLFATMSIFAQKTIRLWDGTDVSHKEKWSKLTVFIPQTPNKSATSVIICPGGSYYWLDMNNEGYSVAKYLNNMGITAFVLHYRTAMMGNHYPVMIQDLQRAIQWVKENSHEYGIEPEKVGVMGFSAGGHLAGTAALYSDTIFFDSKYSSNISLKPFFAAMIYPVVSMEDSICHKKSRNNLLGKHPSDKMQQQMSLELNVYENMPPIFLLHCTGDKTVDYRNSVALDKALTIKNVKHKYLLLDETGHGGHGFGIQPNGKATGWIDEFVKWIEDL
jgi:acetyl esterase/lipase